MRKVILPEGKVKNAADQMISAKDLIESFVLALPFWKANDLKIIDSFLAINAALAKMDGGQWLISEESRGHLLQAMTLMGPNGMTGSINDIALNRLYARIQRALHVAEDLSDEAAVGAPTPKLES